MPSIFGLRKIGNPYDSIKFFLDEDFADTTVTFNEVGDWLTLNIDTSQEIDLSESFSKSEKDYNLYSTPRQIKVVSENGQIKLIKCNKDTSFDFKAMPVTISNLTESPKSIFIKEYAIEITQEAKDRNGRWKPIELTRNFMCAMGFHWMPLKPNEQILTLVYKYRGNYKTILRLKLKSGDKIIYSKPFSGSINYSQFDIDKIHYIDWLPYEK